MGRWRLLHFSRFYLNFLNASKFRFLKTWVDVVYVIFFRFWTNTLLATLATLIFKLILGFLKHRFISKKDLNILSWSWTGSGPGVATLPAQLSVTSNTKCATATAQSKSFSRRRKTRLHHHDHYKDFSSRKMTSLNNK